MRRSFIMIVIMLLVAGCTPPEPHGIVISSQSEGYLVIDGRDSVLFYQTAPKSGINKKGKLHTRENYFHPVYGLLGEVLTEDFPNDHAHHHGIFWGWEQIYIGEKKIGHGWEFNDFSQDVQDVETKRFDDGSAALKTHVLWTSPNWTDGAGQQKPFVEEQAFVRIYPATAKKRIIDFQITLKALEANVRLGGASNDKAYGGFSTRIRMPDDLVFIGKDGAVTPARTPVEAGPWLDMVATFKEGMSKTGVAVFCHPSNPGFPQPWILRQQRSMQNVVWPGQFPVPIAIDQPLVLRYRVVMHSHAVTSAEVQQWFDEYASMTDITK